MANGEPGASAPLQRITDQIDLFQDEAAQIEDREGWRLLRVRWIGRKQGIVRSLLGQLKDVPPAEKKDFGQIVNQLKELVAEYALKNKVLKKSLLGWDGLTGS